MNIEKTEKFIQVNNFNIINKDPTEKYKQKCMSWLLNAE